MGLLPETDIYAITDSVLSKGRSVIEVARDLLTAGVRIIQYREKNKSGREMLAECQILRTMTKQAKACFIINDHVDIAAIVHADGVHVGQDDLPVSAIRQIVPQDFIIGVSTHSPEQAQKAVADGADYIGVGPLFATQTKSNVCAPVGLEYLEYAVKHINIPLVAIGGIKAHNISKVVKHGAKCCCLVSELVSAPDIVEQVAAVRKAMHFTGNP